MGLLDEFLNAARKDGASVAGGGQPTEMAAFMQKVKMATDSPEFRAFIKEKWEEVQHMSMAEIKNLYKEAQAEFRKRREQ